MLETKSSPEVERVEVEMVLSSNIVGPELLDSLQVWILRRYIVY